VIRQEIEDELVRHQVIESTRVVDEALDAVQNDPSTVYAVYEQGNVRYYKVPSWDEITAFAGTIRGFGLVAIKRGGYAREVKRLSDLEPKYDDLIELLCQHSQYPYDIVQKYVLPLVKQELETEFIWKPVTLESTRGMGVNEYILCIRKVEQVIQKVRSLGVHCLAMKESRAQQEEQSTETGMEEETLLKGGGVLGPVTSGEINLLDILIPSSPHERYGLYEDETLVDEDGLRRLFLGMEVFPSDLVDMLKHELDYESRISDKLIEFFADVTLP
jgi:hypothetical protein